jgi:4-amino-4-deoxy-L-arabinose transferase-like glycosyltransferase
VPTPLVWLALFVWLACTAWWRPLAVPDEGRYAGVAWEMIRSGDWLTPTLNGLPFFHKPPLFYWFTAISLKVFGLGLWAARLASVLGAVLGAGALYMLVRRWGGGRLAGWATLALVTQPFWFGGAQYANLDMLVAGCITATIVLAAHAVLAQEAGQPHRLALWAAYAMAGLGLLAKGLIGLVLPGGVIVLWLLATGRWRSLWQILSLPGLLVLGAVAAPWFVAMQRLYPDFFHYFFVYQHFQRFTQTGFNNMHPFWYYVPLIVGLSLPWSLTGLWARWWPQDRSVAFLHGRGQGAGRRALRSLAWVWLGLVLLFFSIPASKLPGYVLPTLPPLALIVADLLARRWPGAGARAFGVITAVAALLCVGLIGAAVRFDRQSVRPALPLIQPLLNEGVPLVYVDEFVYDLPFYLARREPVPVVADWSDPDLPLHDNDRKELFDAGEFNPERARALLVPAAQWPALLCAQPRLVVVGPPKAPLRWPELAGQEPAMRLKLSSVWVLERSALQARGLVCP